MNDFISAHLFVLILAAAFVVLTLAAVVITIADKTMRAGGKTLWSLLLLLVPVVGLLAWAGYRWTHRSAAERPVAPSRDASVL